MRHLPLATLFALLVLASCGSEPFYEKTYPIESDTWTYADSLTFEVNIPDTTTVYNLFLEVRHRTDYSFQNLYVNIHTEFPGGRRLSRVVSLELADKAGLWLGDCNGESCTLNIPLQTDAYFNQTGAYRWIIEQYMRKAQLAGISAITFRILEKKDG